MKQITDGVELWLHAERRQMAAAGASTEYLVAKQAMLVAAGYDPSSGKNTGVNKAQSHLSQAEALASRIENDAIRDEFILAFLGSKALKLASGYAVRSGYFHTPEGFQSQVVEMHSQNTDNLPPLGEPIADLSGAVPASKSDILDLLSDGRHAAETADIALQELYLHKSFSMEGFEGSEGAYESALTYTRPARAAFAGVGVGALTMQGASIDGLGPIILEPRSDADANLFVRVCDLQLTLDDDVLVARSENMIARTNQGYKP